MFYDSRMKAGQILLPGASEWDRKCQLTDQEALAGETSSEVLDLSSSRASALAAAVREAGIEIIHVYGDPAERSREIERTGVPWIASRPLPSRRFSFRRHRAPVVANPLTDPPLPEAVAHSWIEQREEPFAIEPKPRYRIGTLGPERKGVRRLVNETAARLARFRDDLEWEMFDEAPSAAALREIDVWVDPATDPGDFAGFTAEALVAGKRVVACRTPINMMRLEGGTGFAVPIDDPNELAHAIVTALFKEEITLPRLEVSFRESPRRFDPARRGEALVALYNRALNARK